MSTTPGVKTYCCYGMYCDIGHSSDCPTFNASYRAPQPPAGEPAVVEELRAALYQLTGQGKHVTRDECESMLRAALQQLEQGDTHG